VRPTASATSCLWLEFEDCADEEGVVDVEEVKVEGTLNPGRETVGGKVGVGKKDEGEELAVTSSLKFPMSKWVGI